MLSMPNDAALLEPLQNFLRRQCGDGRMGIVLYVAGDDRICGDSVRGKREDRILKIAHLRMQRLGTVAFGR